MKICILTHTFPKYINDATSAAFMHPLALGFKQAGNEVTVLVPYNPFLKVNNFPYRVVSYKYIWPLSLHVLGYSQTLNKGMKFKKRLYFLSPFFFFFAIIALWRLCLKERFDIISSHWILPNGFIAFIASKITKTPYVVTLAGSDVYLAKKNILFTQMAVMAANKASAVLADSPKFLDDIVNLGAKVKKSEIIPYPVDTDKFKPNDNERLKLRAEFGFKNEDIVVFGMGRLIYKKGFKFLIEACSSVIKENKHVYLVIGGDGDLRESLEKFSFDLGSKDHIKFVGSINRDKAPAYYNMCDIFVMPSISDEQGNMDDQPVALIEAMACGKPIIATNFPGISLTVKDGASGFLVSQKDAFLIEKFLIKLILSDKLRKEMGIESRRIVLNKLSIGKIGQRYAEIFRSILK